MCVADTYGYALWRAKRLLNISLKSTLNMAHPTFCSMIRAKNSKVQSRSWWNHIRSKSFRALHTTPRAKVKLREHTRCYVEKSCMTLWISNEEALTRQQICQIMQELWIWTKKRFSAGCLHLKCIMGGRITSGFFTWLHMSTFEQNRRKIRRRH